nr:CRTAC1 family protein [uncultured Celeribacter sp.]
MIYSRLPLLCALAAAPLMAAAQASQPDSALDSGVRFLDRSDALPDHSYTGGWEHFVGGGVAIFDCNNDALPDLFVAGGDSPASLMINRSAPGGSLRFDRAPLFEITGVTGAYPIDIDNDGLLDLAVLRVGENLLLRGEKDCRFGPANTAWGFDGSDRWTTAFAAGWEGDAARPTLFFGNYVNRDDPDGPFEACDSNALYRPTEAAKGWTKTTLEPGFCPLSALISKGARDHLALRLSNDRHYYVRGGYEQVYDLSKDRFLGESDGWERVSLWGMGIAERDINGDQIPDVMLTSMGDQLLQFGRPDGGYEAAPYDIGSYAHRPHLGDDGRPSTGWQADWGDVDNDGRADLFIAKGNVEQMPGLAAHDPNNLLQQTPDGRFAEVSVAAGVASMAKSRGGGLVDLNADGRLDLVVVNRESSMELYENSTEMVGNYIAVDLRQSGPNTRAVGAQVEIDSRVGRQMQEVMIGGGHGSGKSVALHFGLGTATTARLRITWPDGTVSDWQNVETVNRTLTVTHE